VSGLASCLVLVGSVRVQGSAVGVGECTVACWYTPELRLGLAQVSSSVPLFSFVQVCDSVNKVWKKFDTREGLEYSKQPCSKNE